MTSRAFTFADLIRGFAHFVGWHPWRYSTLVYTGVPRRRCYLCYRTEYRLDGGPWRAREGTWL